MFHPNQKPKYIYQDNTIYGWDVVSFSVIMWGECSSLVARYSAGPVCIVVGGHIAIVVSSC